MKRKIIGIIGFSVLSIVLIGLYFNVNGNPYTKYQAREAAKEYIAQTYPEIKNYDLSRGKHDWYSGDYSYDITTSDDHGNKSTSSVVMGYTKPYGMVLDTRAEALVDMDKSATFSEQASAHFFKKLTEQNIPFAKTDHQNDVQISIPKDNSDTKWSLQTKTFGLMTGNYELKSKLSKDEFLAEVKKAQKVFNDSGLTYDKIWFYNDDYDYYFTKDKIIKL